MVFMGFVKFMVLEVIDLKLVMLVQRRVKFIDLYVFVYVDDVYIVQMFLKLKILMLIWNEEFESEIENGEILGIIVFYNVIMLFDLFLVNLFVFLEEIIKLGIFDIWVWLG